MAITIQYLREFANYQGFDDISKSWVYKLNNRTFVWNRDGLQEEK